MVDARDRRRLRENWLRVQDEVHRAAELAGRSPDAIQIIGVSKYVGEALTEVLVDVGCKALGESRPQSIWQKADAIGFGPDVRWHLIGHLQRNKVRRTIGHDPIIHSIDSLRLLRSVAEHSVAQKCSTSVLLEVNISGDESKTGLAKAEVADLIRGAPEEGVQIVGLMAMAGWGTDRDAAREQFEQTRQFRDRLCDQTGLPLQELSMGMSGDFAEAIAAGATMVRIGSRLFDGLMAT